MAYSIDNWHKLFKNINVFKDKTKMGDDIVPYWRRPKHMAIKCYSLFLTGSYIINKTKTTIKDIWNQWENWIWAFYYWFNVNSLGCNNSIVVMLENVLVIRKMQNEELKSKWSCLLQLSFKGFILKIHPYICIQKVHSYVHVYMHIWILDSALRNVCPCKWSSLSLSEEVAYMLHPSSCYFSVGVYQPG